MFAVPAVVGS